VGWRLVDAGPGSRNDPADVHVENHGVLAEGKSTDGGCGVFPHPRERSKLILIPGYLPAVLMGDRDRGRVQP
jgi:hypothetical protein